MLMRLNSSMLARNFLFNNNFLNTGNITPLSMFCLCSFVSPVGVCSSKFDIRSSKVNVLAGGSGASAPVYKLDEAEGCKYCNAHTYERAHVFQDVLMVFLHLNWLLRSRPMSIWSNGNTVDPTSGNGCVNHDFAKFWAIVSENPAIFMVMVVLTNFVFLFTHFDSCQ
jgi:hypothetical protein